MLPPINWAGLLTPLMRNNFGKTNKLQKAVSSEITQLTCFESSSFYQISANDVM